MKFLWKKLYQDLEAELKVSGGSWRKLARAAGVTPSVFTRISKGHPLSVMNLLKIVDPTTPEGLTRWVKR